MANKPVQKYPIDKEIFMKILKEKNLTIRKLDNLPNFDYTSRSIERALRTGQMSYNLAHSLSILLDKPIYDFC